MISPFLIFVNGDYSNNVEQITKLLQNFDVSQKHNSIGQNPKYGDSAWIPMELHLEADTDPEDVRAFLDQTGITVVAIKARWTIGTGGVVQPTQEGQIQVVGRLIVSAAAARLAEPTPTEPKELLLDRASFRVRRDGRWLRLNPMDFELLEYLHANPDRVIPRAEFISALWTQDKRIKERTVDVRIKRLREALGDHGNDGLIRTHRNAGYYFSGR